MSKQGRYGQLTNILGENSQRVKDQNAQKFNISAARAVAEAVRSTLGPKGMDKMLVDSMGSTTITNDGATILQEMDIDNPAAEMILEVAETQESEAGDGTTTAIIIAGELLRNAEYLLEQDIHPSTIRAGFHLASTTAREEIDDIAERVDPDDEALLKMVAETAMTGKFTEHAKEDLAELIVEGVQKIVTEGNDGARVVNLDLLDIETQVGWSNGRSELLVGARIEKSPTLDTMPKVATDATILLLGQAIEAESTATDITINPPNHEQFQGFLDREDEQLKEKVQHIADLGVDVVFCQRNIDTLARQYLSEKGIIATRLTTGSDLNFLSTVTGAQIVSNLSGATEDALGYGDVTRDADDEVFHVTGEEPRAATLMLRGSTKRVVKELEDGVTDALNVVAHTVSDGRVLAGGGSIEIELASRLRDHADSVSGREQLAIEAFADSLELIPRILAENAGQDPIDTLVDLRKAHASGNILTGLDVLSGDTINTLESGIIEPAHSKEQALSSATEAANLILKIDDIVAADDLSTASNKDEKMNGMR